MAVFWKNLLVSFNSTKQSCVQAIQMLENHREVVSIDLRGMVLGRASAVCDELFFSLTR